MIRVIFYLDRVHLEQQGIYQIVSLRKARQYFAIHTINRVRLEDLKTETDLSKFRTLGQIFKLDRRNFSQKISPNPNFCQICDRLGFPKNLIFDIKTPKSLAT